MKDKLIAMVFLLIMALNFFGVLTDVSLGVPNWHIFTESFIVLISGILGVFLVFDIKKRTKRLAILKQQLTDSNNKIKSVTDEMILARTQYSQVIHNQFELWKLTNSEQEVSMLLLKGLSFKEVSEARQTKEKTVRQQASAIYSKANVEGRHEFAAWFLDDFIAVN